MIKSFIKVSETEYEIEYYSEEEVKIMFENKLNDYGKIS